MSVLATIHASLPCPSCGVPASLPVSVQVAGPFAGHSARRALPEGRHVGTVSECASCWRRRVEIIQGARAKLRSAGILGGHGVGPLTWKGARPRMGSDPVADAIASELLRSGFSPIEVRQRVEVEVRAQHATVRLPVEAEQVVA